MPEITLLFSKNGDLSGLKKVLWGILKQILGINGSIWLTMVRNKHDQGHKREN